MVSACRSRTYRYSSLCTYRSRFLQYIHNIWAQFRVVLMVKLIVLNGYACSVCRCTRATSPVWTSFPGNTLNYMATFESHKTSTQHSTEWKYWNNPPALPNLSYFAGILLKFVFIYPHGHPSAYPWNDPKLKEPIYSVSYKPLPWIFEGDIFWQSDDHFEWRHLVTVRWL